jgi:D-alanyl-D-alanine carboxypeptidase
MGLKRQTTLQKAKDFLVSRGIDPASIEKRSIPYYKDESRLVVADVSQSGREHLLTQETAIAWSKMKSEAFTQDISLIIVSAFRSFDRQVEIVQHSLEQGEDFESIFKTSAPPGYSEHHTGRAIDIGTMGCEPLSEEFGKTEAFEWLKVNANKFGFRLSYPKNNPYGFKYEPWHWFYQERVSYDEK